MPDRPLPLRLHRSLLFFAATLSVGKVFAQADAPAELAPVVVQASKQGQTLDEIGTSVSVLDGETLEQNRVGGLGDLAQRVPGLSFQPIGQSNLQPVVMRGLSAGPTSFSSSMVLMVDGVPTLSGFGFDDSLVGVDYIEVLRGPQSTLFGRNAQTGVINVATRKPSGVPRADLSAELGQHERRVLRFDVGGPLVDGLLYAGIAGDWTEQRGYIDNTHTGHDENGRERRSGRLALRWTPGSATDVTLRYARREYRDGASDWGPMTGPRYRVASGTEGFDRSQIDALSLNVEHVFAGGITLQAVTARSRVRDRQRQDTDFLPADLFHQERDYTLENLSQEIRLFGRWRGMDWLAGVYLDRDDNDLAFHFKTPLMASTSSARQNNRSAAAFTHWSIPIAGPWSLAAGARLERTRARIAIPAEAAQRTSWTHVSPKLALRYQPDRHTSAYFSVAEGYRAGGYNAFAPQANRLYDAYDPETLLAYEIGLRKAWPGLGLNLGAALYHMEVDDMHVQQILPGTSNAYIANAAKARSSGLELDAQYRLAPGWRLQGSVAFNRTRFRDYSDANGRYDGNRNAFAPDVQGSIGVRYDSPHRWYLQADVVASGKIYLDAANRYRRPGYGRLDLSGGWRIGRTDISAYVRNATDRHYDAVGYLSGTATIFSPPREIGLRLRYQL